MRQITRTADKHGDPQFIGDGFGQFDDAFDPRFVGRAQEIPGQPGQ